MNNTINFIIFKDFFSLKPPALDQVFVNLPIEIFELLSIEIYFIN